jgi:hypothetical protein
MMASTNTNHWALNTAPEGGASAPPRVVSPAWVPSCPIAVPFPAASAGPAPPAYVLFARFLS